MNDILTSAVIIFRESKFMKNNSSMQVLNDANSKAHALSRREWIARMLGGVTAGVAFPGLAAAHPVREVLTDSSNLTMADASVAAADWTPEFLDSFQAETLAALAERII